MEAVNAMRPRKPLTKGQLDDNDNARVEYHLNNLLAAHLSNPDLTPQEIAEASRSAAAAAATAAKAARATAFEKAAAAAKAVAAAKSALDLIASFPDMKKHVAADLQQGEVSQGILSNASFRDTEHAISKRLHCNGLGMEFGGDGAKEETPVARKRGPGRPKSK